MTAELRKGRGRPKEPAGGTAATGGPGGTRLPAGQGLRALLLNRSTVLLFGLALLFRVLYLLEYRHSPFWCLLFGDPKLYHERAVEILHGDLLGRGVSFHSSPLYPYFLALTYRVFGVSIPAVFTLQGIIGATDVVLVATCARLLLGPWGFWLAGVPLACWPVLAYLNAEQLEITMVLLGVHLMLLALLRARGAELVGGSPRRRIYLWAGLALGLAVLGKPNSILFLPCWWITEWLRLRTTSAGPAGTAAAGVAGVVDGAPSAAGVARAALRESTRRAGLVLAGVACAVAPFTIRNLAVNHDLVLTSANGGIDLYIGNNPGARGIFWVPTVLQGELYESSRRVAENALGRTLRASEVSNYWARRALSWVRGAPAAAVALTARKLLLMLNGLEISNHFDPNFLARDVFLLRVSPFRFGLWIPFAFWGMALAAARARRPRPGRTADRLAGILLVWILAYGLSLLPFFITARYRTPIVPALLVFSAYGILDLVQRIRARRVDRALAVGGGVVAAGFVLTHLPLIRAEEFYFNQEQVLAADARDRGDYAAAAALYAKALEMEPRSVIAHNSLAICLARLGKVEQGVDQLEQALHLDPQFPLAWRNLAILRREQGDLAGEREALTRAVALDPRFREARQDLVRSLIAQKDYPAALENLDALLRFDPEDREALWNRALLLGQYLGRKDEALRALDRLEMVTGPDARSRALRRSLTGPAAP